MYGGVKREKAGTAVAQGNNNRAEVRLGNLGLHSSGD